METKKRPCSVWKNAACLLKKFASWIGSEGGEKFCVGNQTPPSLSGVCRSPTSPTMAGSAVALASIDVSYCASLRMDKQNYSWLRTELTSNRGPCVGGNLCSNWNKRTAQIINFPHREEAVRSHVKLTWARTITVLYRKCVFMLHYSQMLNLQETLLEASKRSLPTT